MNETSINAKLNALEQQRNIAANQVVNLTADLTVMQEERDRLKTLADKAIKRVEELEAKYEPPEKPPEPDAPKLHRKRAVTTKTAGA